MQSLLFGISPVDPITFTAMPVVLAATAMLASYLSTCCRPEEPSR